MARIFGVAILVSAALLFCLQPLVGKMLLAPLGGAPAVWNTCMVFFQALLLAGYVYAHVIVTRLGVKRQAVVHVALVALPWIVLPVALRGTPTTGGDAPTFAVLSVLARSVGLPFFVLSTTAPLVQRWFSRLGTAGAKDPYFLYAASNFGSMVALVAYPIVIEPLIGLRAQASFWAGGYALFGLCIVGCVVLLLRAPTKDAADEPPPDDVPRATWRERLRWIVLALVPSSLLMGVTHHVTTDIAAIPLFWVIPLALYLVTFMLVFARRPPIPHRWMVRIFPLFATITLVCIIGEATEPRWPVAFVHVSTAFVAFMVCHGELVAARPPVFRLTEFYLCMSLGGVLGGIFNALVAPSIFTGIVEYPLAVVAACALRARPADQDDAPNQRRLDLAIPVALGLFTLVVAVVARSRPLPLAFHFLVAPALFVNYRWLERPVRFAAGLAAVFVASLVYPGHLGASLDRERNFFGVVRVTRDPTSSFVQVVHGNTIHGRQSLDPARKDEPLTYYHPTGPAGDVFAESATRGSSSRVASIGLGAGALAHYARLGDTWTLYEINPAVVRMAKEHFTFLRDAKCGVDRQHFEIGDARVRLVAAPDASFDVVVLDAFSSDSIPAHLLTREALHLYLQKLAPNGLVAMHVSNRYLDLLPPIAALVADAGLAARFRDDQVLTEELLARGKTPSTWVAIARTEAELGTLGRLDRWMQLPARAGRVWTDDFSNLVTALRW